MLRRKGPDAFERFVAALMNCDRQKFIAEVLTTAEYRTHNLDTGQNVSRYSKTDDDISKWLSGCIDVWFFLETVLTVTSC